MSAPPADFLLCRRFCFGATIKNSAHIFEGAPKKIGDGAHDGAGEKNKKNRRHLKKFGATGKKSATQDKTCAIGTIGDGFGAPHKWVPKNNFGDNRRNRRRFQRTPKLSAAFFSASLEKNGATFGHHLRATMGTAGADSAHDLPINSFCTRGRGQNFALQKSAAQFRDKAQTSGAPKWATSN